LPSKTGVITSVTGYQSKVRGQCLLAGLALCQGWTLKQFVTLCAYVAAKLYWHS